MHASTCFKFLAVLFLVVPAFSAQALIVSVDCSKKSLATEIGKLNKAAENTVNVSGNCNENVVVDGHANLILNGSAGATITATNTPAAIALRIINSSRVRVQTLNLGAATGENRTVVSCEMRSVCVLNDVTIEGGATGVGAQDQAAVDIVGGSLIINSSDTGLGVFGASSVNVRPCPLLNDSCAGLGSISAEISGHTNLGIVAQDGSFVRTDNARISGNGTGVLVQRGAVVKILGGPGTPVPGAGIIDNEWGMYLRAATAQVGGLVSGNAIGIEVAALSFLQNAGITFDANGQNVACTHPTAASTGGLCP